MINSRRPESSLPVYYVVLAPLVCCLGPEHGYDSDNAGDAEALVGGTDLGRRLLRQLKDSGAVHRSAYNLVLVSIELAAFLLETRGRNEAAAQLRDASLKGSLAGSRAPTHAAATR